MTGSVLHSRVWGVTAFLLAVALSVPIRAAEESAKKDATRSETKPKPVGVGDELSFRQAKVATEMAELEERIFRLSEALKALEPENASRLMLGLKFAREELILHQMKETQKLLNKLSLSEAAGEEKLLLTKLERLHDLLLATDLDFQLQLERLRQMRDILRRLDKAIAEEERERKASDASTKQERELKRLQKKQASLEELIRREQDHLDQGRQLAERKELSETDQKSLGKLARDQKRTRNDTKALAAESGTSGDASPNLGAAEASMGKATDALEQKTAAPAVPHQDEAVKSLEKERERNGRQLVKLEKELAKDKFAAMKQDQSQNRQANDAISQMVRGLGSSGASALDKLGKAGGSMAKAESDLDQQNPSTATNDQQQALDELRKARDDLDSEANKLLEQLMPEVRRRVIEALTLMLEQQTAIREQTEQLGPKAATGSRAAQIALQGLARSEGRIATACSEILSLVIETEFGIALPAALEVVRDAMTAVEKKLSDGDGSPKVVVAEQEIEADLRALLDAMKQMPASKPSSGKPKKGPQDREKELNRLTAELKMIRLLQVRVLKQTEIVDGRRPPDPEALSTEIKRQIEAVTGQQDHVRSATERLSDQREQKK
jgi:hypothetical protein